jgi:dTDP-4-amino-4,6-dideoxygalactose transaminase
VKIPLLDLVAQYQSIKGEIDPAVMDVLAKGSFVLGSNVAALEQEIAGYLGVDYAVGLASGTDALIIALRAAGVGPDDEVIVPAYTFFATAGAVLSVGARPVFVDVFENSYLMDYSQIERAITSKTKALIPVHLYGLPADMAEIMAIAEKHRLIVIEDNAQAFGAQYKNNKTASIGHVSCLSFFPSKNLGGYGDGGMLVTNESSIAEQARMLRAHGWRKKYFPEILGYNSRLDELQAAILRVKLHHLDAWNQRRRAIAQTYTKAFTALGLRCPLEMPDRQHVYHLYVAAFEQRDRVQQGLKAQGIASGVYYPQPVHLTQPCRALGGKEGQYPVSEQASRETLAIPIYPEMKRDQIDFVIQNIKNM